MGVVDVTASKNITFTCCVLVSASFSLNLTLARTGELSAASKSPLSFSSENHFSSAKTVFSFFLIYARSRVQICSRAIRSRCSHSLVLSFGLVCTLCRR